MVTFKQLIFPKFTQQKRSSLLLLGCITLTILHKQKNIQMKFLKLFTIISLFLLSNCASTNSQPSNKWRLLGEKKVDFSPDRDVMIVNSSPLYNKIKVRVYNGKVIMEDMKVYFGNDEVMDVTLSEVYKDGGYSRDIELPKGNRHISKITFRYRTARNSFEKATVEVWGSK